MQSTRERVKNKGSTGQLGAQSTTQSRDERPTEVKIAKCYVLAKYVAN